MSRPMVKEHNLQTNEIIDREMNDAEFAAWQTEQAEWIAEEAARQAAEAAKAEAKASAESKLSALGLTPDEIAALRG